MSVLHHIRVQVVFCGMLFLVGCVSTNFTRIGRQPLFAGTEGRVQIFSAIPSGFEDSAKIQISSAGIRTPEQLERHLLRRASLLGCDGIVNPKSSPSGDAQAVCVKRREPEVSDNQQKIEVSQPRPELLERAARAGAHGKALLKVLKIMQSRAPQDRAWPLQWYLKQYPQSPFYAEVKAMLEPHSTPELPMTRLASAKTTASF